MGVKMEVKGLAGVLLGSHQTKGGEQKHTCAARGFKGVLASVRLLY